MKTIRDECLELEKELEKKIIEFCDKHQVRISTIETDIAYDSLSTYSHGTCSIQIKI